MKEVIYKIGECAAILEVTSPTLVNDKKVFVITKNIKASKDEGIEDEFFNFISKHYSKLVNECSDWRKKLNLYNRFSIILDLYTNR